MPIWRMCLSAWWKAKRRKRHDARGCRGSNASNRWFELHVGRHGYLLIVERWHSAGVDRRPRSGRLYTIGWSAWFGFS